MWSSPTMIVRDSLGSSGSGCQGSIARIVAAARRRRKMADQDEPLTAKGVHARENELRAPEAPVVPAGSEPEAVAQPKRREERREATRRPRSDPVVGPAAGEEAARPEPAQERRLALGEERRVGRPPN